MEFLPTVDPGDNLVVEWNEMFSMGVGDLRQAPYGELPPGNYAFHVQGVDIFGVPTGMEALLKVIVPPPFWRMPWFWGVVFMGITAMMFGAGRYAVRHKMRREMLRLEHQQELERERVRIAHDIHDDLGVRITRIALLTAVAEVNSTYSEKARADFGRVSQMSRELVSALYETVWAVNPENDNLDALGNYLCQMIHQLCEQAKLSCRLRVPELPSDVQVASQLRHNVILAVKEAINNIIKHARATEVAFQVTFERDILTISITDNGSGFDAANRMMGNGNGLSNMKLRLEAVGGRCNIETSEGKGTTILMHVTARLVESPGEKSTLPREAGI